MIQMQTKLLVADNSGAKEVKCVKVLGGSKRMSAGLGDIIVVAVQQTLPGGKIKKGDVKKAVIVRTAYPLRREDGSYIQFDPIPSRLPFSGSSSIAYINISPFGSDAVNTMT